MDEINRRIAVLERQVRRSRTNSGALFVAFVVTLATCAGFSSATGQAGTPKQRRVDELTLRRLVIVDETGAKRIVLGSDSLGSAGSAYFDREGRLRIETVTRADRSAGTLHHDRAGQERIATLTLNDESAGLLLRDGSGSTRVTATTRRDGAAGLDHFDRKGNRRIVVGTAPDDQGNVFHFDAAGIKRLMAVTTLEGSVVIGITDRDGRPTWIEGDQ